MFQNVLAAEQVKLLRRPLLWITLGILGGLILFLIIGIFTFGSAGELTEFRWPYSLVTLLSIAAQPLFGGVVVVVLAGFVIAQGYTWRTLHLWLSHGVSRTVWLNATFSALLLPLLLVVLTPLLLGGIATACFTYQLEGAPAWNQINPGYLLLSVLLTAYTLLPYATLTGLLAVVGRSPAAALGGGIAFLFVENILAEILSFAGDIGARIMQLLPWMLGNGLLQFNQAAVDVQIAAAEDAPQLLNPGPAMLGIAAYTLLFGGLTLWLFRRQDLTG
jgi:ABC-2 type transport system permease protein